MSNKENIDFSKAAASGNLDEQYLTAYIGGHIFGLPVPHLRDIFRSHQIAPIPLSPECVLGSINLRGKIVTAIDLRIQFNIESQLDEKKASMNVAVEYNGELYSLVVDRVGEVLSLPDANFDPLPPTLEKRWKSYSTGVYQLNERLLIRLNIEKVLNAIINRQEENS